MSQQEPATRPVSRRGARALGGRSWVISGAIAYVTAFHYAYIYVVEPIVGYLGFTYNDPQPGELALALALAILPAFWIRPGLTRPSQWFYLYLYVAVYVPVCLVPLYRAAAAGRPSTELLPLWVAMFVCFAILGIGQYLPLLAIRIRPMNPRLFWAAVGILLAVAYVALYATYGTNLRFAGEGMIREQRMQGRDLFAASSMPLLVGYSMSWPAYAINPFLIAYGVCSRRYKLILIAVAGQLFLYSTNAARGVLAAAILPVLILFLFRKRERFGARTLWTFATGITVASIINGLGSPFVKIFMSWLVSRTFAGAGLLTDAYYSFFSTNPFTGFAQVRGFGAFSWNPYEGRSVGFIIGDSLNQFGNQANANFWADGYASLGFAGMLIVTLVTLAALYIVDSASRDVELKYMLMVTAAHAMTLADVPVFTVLLGQGLMFVVLLAVFAPRVPGITRQIVPGTPSGLAPA